MSDYLGEIHLLAIVCYIWNLTFAVLGPDLNLNKFYSFLERKSSKFIKRYLMYQKRVYTVKFMILL